MSDNDKHPRLLQDPESGNMIEVIYAIPPQMVRAGERSHRPGASIATVITRLRNRWRLVAILTCLGAAIGLVTALTAPNRYTASATALPPSDKAGGGLLAQYAGLAAAAGIQLPNAPTSSVDSIMAILDSRRLREPLIEKFSLRQYYASGTREDALDAFSRDFDPRNDKKTNTIIISVSNRSSELAAQIANEAADLLRGVYNEINQSTAAREREFLEARVNKAEADASAAARALAEFQAAKGAVELESQTKATIEAIAKLQGELIVQQIELKAMLGAAASPGNPEIQLVQGRIDAISDKMEQMLGAGGSDPGVLIGLGNLPDLGIAYLEKYRAVKKHEAIHAALVAQLEAARFGEARTSEVVTIVDRAFAPERKSGPPRAQICIAAVVFSFVAACAWVVLIPALRARLVDPPGPHG